MKKHKYHVSYVNNKNQLLSFDVEAASWQELKDAIDSQLPSEAEHICSISYDKWKSDFWRE